MIRVKSDSNETLAGNQQFKGFCIDLLDKIASMCNFTYKIKLVDDGFHGAFVNGRWNGMVGELIDKVKIFIHFVCSKNFLIRAKKKYA